MSQGLSFERFKHIQSKYKHDVCGCLNSWIPESLELIILLFYYISIELSILTDNECNKLLSLFEQESKFKDLGNYSYKLIFRQTRYGKELSEFKSRCHGKTNVLCSISTECGNVFGGYT